MLPLFQANIKKRSYTSLTPTLGDYLKTVKDNKPAAETSSEEISIPILIMS